MSIGFGKNTGLSSAKYVPYLYDRIKSIVLSFTNNSELLSNVDNILIPCDYPTGDNPIFTNSGNTFYVYYGGINQTSSWTIDVLTETNVTTSQVDNTISITAISADEGEYVVRAVRTDYTTITKTIKVYKSKLSGEGLDGLGWTGGSYESSTGVVTFTSDDGLGFVTGDLRGEDGTDGGGTIQDPTTYAIKAVNEDGVIGNTRGGWSVDLQTYRSAATQVASGGSAVLGGGTLNTVSSIFGFVGGGQENTVAGGVAGWYSSILGGFSNTITNGHSQAIGSYNTISNRMGTCIGIGGTTTTNGELVLSSSDSSSQKSIFLLEVETNSTSATTMQTLLRGAHTSAYAENIHVDNDRCFVGTITLKGSNPTASGFYSETRYLDFSCDSSGNIINVATTATTHTNTVNGTNGVLSFVTTTTNELIVQVTASNTDATKWTCLIEGIIMDS